MIKSRLLSVLLIIFIFAALPAIAQEATPAATPASTASATQEASVGCVTNYDPNTDYFPDKVKPEYAKGWTVEYHNSYKVVDVTTPWPGATAKDAFEYVLVECGTPAPSGYDGAEVIQIPSGKVIALGTEYVPQLQELGLLDDLIGVDSVALYSTPEIAQMAAAKKLIEVGSGASVNVEAILDAQPGLVLTFGSGDPTYDTHPVLIKAGVPVVVASDYVEQSPLGQAEWIKFTALFYNKEGEANAIFDQKASAYDDLAKLTSTLSDDQKPLILWNSYSSYGNSWNIPGSESFAAHYIHDAGAKLVLGDDPKLQGNNNTLPFDFEAVYNAGLDAKFWFPGVFGVKTLADLVAQDARYADFNAVKTDQVYNNDARLGAGGGDDYYESGVANPQDVLADLIKIMHPDLVPDHPLVYFRQLPPK
ncbi:MAG TPA: ABC transporter substrate-binding protein [Phototrophicaceae bacterium]|nr:ABC transporter substrate-binding protein [Phototrophicaceae bacterium]